MSEALAFLFAASTAVFAALYVRARNDAREQFAKFLGEVMRHGKTFDDLRKLKADLQRADMSCEKPTAKFVPCEGEREVQK